MVRAATVSAKGEGAPARRRDALPVRKIVRRKLSDEVFDRLLKEIESGFYPPNAHIPSERELMAAYGVGRPAIREAMQRLEKLGLIVITHGERARVSEPTVADVIGQIEHAARHILMTQPHSLSQLQDARIFFEIGMVREAARLAQAEDVARLEAALASQAAFLHRDSGRFVAADMEFHTVIAGISRNGVLEAVSRAMLHWLSMFHAGLLLWKGHETVTLEEHRMILDAIIAHDEDAAADAMRTHLLRSRGLFLSANGQVQTPFPLPGNGA
ncbi:MAG TPA: transcriptional regulator NanR [Acidisoma sp.]|jgi:DNA-binding FadR family transcriptional regulator|nr:transcriptional regulator NanR [Acidisoma sp.]